MVGLEVIQCLNLALVLPWLIVVSCLCEKELAIKMHLWVYGCSCAEQEGGVWNKLLNAWDVVLPPSEGVRLTDLHIIPHSAGTDKRYQFND